MDKRNFKTLQDKLGYSFNNLDLFRQSLMHSSYVNENGLDRITSNERLEFLGDSVLEMSISLLIFEHKPAMTEGEMSKLRAELVCEKSLSTLALELDLGAFLLLGRGECNAGGRKRPSTLADAFEAVIAAIYLDGGLTPAMHFVERTFHSQIEKLADKKAEKTDYKTVLQEYVQTKPEMSHIYELTGEAGPDHDKTFTVEVKINGELKGAGTGKNKKSAEQAAAKEAIQNLTGER